MQKVSASDSGKQLPGQSRQCWPQWTKYLISLRPLPVFSSPFLLKFLSVLHSMAFNPNSLWASFSSHSIPSALHVYSDKMWQKNSFAVTIHLNAYGFLLYDILLMHAWMVSCTLVNHLDKTVRITSSPQPNFFSSAHKAQQHASGKRYIWTEVFCVCVRVHEYVY